MVFEDNVGENGLSSQSTYKVDIDCPYYKASIALNPKVLNDLKTSKEQLEKGFGVLTKEVNDFRLQFDSKRTLSCIDCQENYYGHGVQEQWPWLGRSLNMVEPTLIHGQLVQLV